MHLAIHWPIRGVPIHFAVLLPGRIIAHCPLCHRCIIKFSPAHCLHFIAKLGHHRHNNQPARHLFASLALVTDGQGLGQCCPPEMDGTLNISLLSHFGVELAVCVFVFGRLHRHHCDLIVLIFPEVYPGKGQADY